MATVSKKIKIDKLVGGLFAVIATMSIAAFYHSDSTLISASAHSVYILVIEFLSVVAVVLSLPLINFKKLNLGIWLAICTVVVFALINIFHNYETNYNGILLVVQWTTFCLLPKSTKKYAFEVFKKIWVVICLLGILCYLCYMLKIPLPYRRVPYYLSGASLNYINYGLSILYENSTMVRVCGFCNEPGYLGTFCALLLCADGMNLKKGTNLIILLAGLLSFSAAFFMIVLVYIALKIVVITHDNKNVKKKILCYFAAICMLFAYFVILPNIETGNTAIDKTLQRLTVTSEGLAGDNRTTQEFDALYNRTMESDLWFGKGYGYTKKVITNHGNSSYKVRLVEYGVIGCLLIWGLLLWSVLYKNTKNKNIILFVIVFFASIYQRPNIITVPYLVVLMGGIEYIKSVSCMRMLKNDDDLKSVNGSENVTMIGNIKNVLR